MCTDSSANRTAADAASGVEYTATDLIPSSLHARAIRTAISPRLAIRIFWNTQSPQWPDPLLRLGLDRLQEHQHLLKLDPFSILDQDLGDASTVLGGDLVHD